MSQKVVKRNTFGAKKTTTNSGDGEVDEDDEERRANVNGCAKTIDLSQETLLGYTLYLFNIPLTTFPLVAHCGMLKK